MGASVYSKSSNIQYNTFLFFACSPYTARQRTGFFFFCVCLFRFVLFYVRERNWPHRIACRASPQLPLQSVHHPVCHSAWWHHKIQSALTLLSPMNCGGGAEALGAPRGRGGEHFSPGLRPSSVALYHIATLFQVFAKTKKSLLSFTYSLVHSTFFPSLIPLPHPRPPTPTPDPDHSAQWVASSGSVGRVL